MRVRVRARAHTCVYAQGCNVKDISYTWFMTSLSKKKKREKENTTIQDVKDLHPFKESVKWQRKVDLNSSKFHLPIEGCNQAYCIILSVIY